MANVSGFPWANTCRFARALIPFVLASLAVADHLTDGIFSPSEWTGPTVNKTFFAPAPDGSGNAWLYVDQGASTLYLAYDYVGGTTPLTGGSFVDVFFQVPGEHEDYAVRIHSNNTFEVFVKPFGPPSQIASNGSFDLTQPPWSLADASDLQRAQFHAATGFGTTPNQPVLQAPSAPHVFVEFQLEINNNLGGRMPPKDGLYDPAPAFWSAGVLSGPGAASSAHDPPITSAIFTVNPNLTTIVTPVLGANGGPVQQIAEPIAAVATVTRDAFQIRYASNLNIGDSFVNVTNIGASSSAPAGSTGFSGGNLCMNAYVFDQSEELLACCSCFVTPNGLSSFSIKNQLVSNNLTPEIPNSVVVKLVATAGPVATTGAAGGVNGCNAGGTITPTMLAPGMRAWGTTLHALATTPIKYGVTESEFSKSDLSQAELNHLTSFCGFIQSNGSGFGICKGCSIGGLGAAFQK